jgi:hypothetical protein
MGQIRASRFFRALVAFVLAVTALMCGGYSILLFVQVFRGNGSTEGNAYVFTFALILLILFPVALAFSIHHWKLRDGNSNSQSA